VYRPKAVGRSHCQRPLDFSWNSVCGRCHCESRLSSTDDTHGRQLTVSLSDYSSSSLES